MVLSACGGTTPKENGFELFQEDTLAHEELFGSLEDPTSPIKAIHNLEPVPTGEPYIGVQSKEYTIETNNYVALRFVAALNVSLSTNVKWARAIYTDEGDAYKAEEFIPCTKAYTDIYDGGSSFLNIKSVSASYTYFVMYTIKNIPATGFENYFVNLSLSISGADPVKTVSTTVDQTKQISFAYDCHDYFIRGTYHGIENITNSEDDDYASNPLPDGKVARFTQDLYEDDDFYIIRNYVDADPEESKFRIYDSSCIRENPYFEDDTTSADKVVVNETRSYVFYLNDVDEIDVESGYYVAYKNNSNVDVVDPLTYAGKDNEDKNQFKGTIAPKNGSNLVFYTTDPESPLTISSQSGNVSIVETKLAVTYGGPELDLYLKQEPTNYSLWCGYPEFVVKVGGSISPVKSRENTGSDKAIYDINLTTGQKVIISCGYTELNVNGGATSEYSAPSNAHFVFYVNSSYQVWVDELATVTISVEYNTYGNGSLYAVGNFSGDFEPWPIYKLTYNDGNIWTGSFEIKVGKTIKLCVAPTENPTKGTVTAWENDAANRTVVSGGISITGWNVA